MHLNNSDLNYLSNTNAIRAQQLLGRVWRPGMSYRVALAWDGRQLKGRLGGRVFGENVLLQSRGETLLGSVASSGWVYSVHAHKQGNSIECTFVGTENITSAHLELSPNGVSGRLLGQEASYIVSIEQEAGALRAEIGRDADCQEIRLELGKLGWEVLVGVLVADISSRNAWRSLLASYQGSAEG